MKKDAYIALTSATLLTLLLPFLLLVIKSPENSSLAIALDVFHVIILILSPIMIIFWSIATSVRISVGISGETKSHFNIYTVVISISLMVALGLVDTFIWIGVGFGLL